MPSLIAKFSKQLGDLLVNPSDITCSKLYLLKEHLILNLVLCLTDNHAELFAYCYDFMGEEWITDEIERYQTEESDQEADIISHIWNILGLDQSCKHSLNITPHSESHFYGLIAHIKLTSMSFKQRKGFQVKEAFVNEDYQKAGVGLILYSYLREKLKIIISDNLQTVAAMQLWLNKLSKIGHVEVWDLQSHRILGQVFHRDLNRSPNPLWGLSYSSYKPGLAHQRNYLQQQITDLQDDYYVNNICQESEYQHIVLAFVQEK